MPHRPIAAMAGVRQGWATLGPVRRLAAFVLVFALLVSALAALSPPPADSAAEAFDHFYNLEFDSALRIFREMARAHPADPQWRNHVAQTILYREMHRAGALETELVTGGNAFLRREKMNPSPADVAEFESAIAASVRLCQERLAKDPDDKWALYYEGVAHGLRANYDFLVRKAWTDALRQATESRKLHDRVTALDPDFVDARLTQGAHDYIVGSLPWHYRLLGFVVGFRGDKERGIETLRQVRAFGKRNADDAAILLATIYRREKRPADAVPILKQLLAKYPRNYLLGFELAQMYSDLGQKDAALAAVAEVERRKRDGTPGYASLSQEKILYFRATIQFWYRDFDHALENFLAVTGKASDLDPNTGVTAWMRLGQTYDMKGRRAEAIAAYRKAVAYAPGSYRAKEAEDYIRKPYTRVKS
ncbi:MAG: tetratricopeptide repeat protein [Bryobacteraceae bacterium]